MGVLRKPIFIDVPLGEQLLERMIISRQQVPTNASCTVCRQTEPGAHSSWCTGAVKTYLEWSAKNHAWNPIDERSVFEYDGNFYSNVRLVDFRTMYSHCWRTYEKQESPECIKGHINPWIPVAEYGVPEPLVKLIDLDSMVEYSSRSPPQFEFVVGTDQYIAPEAYDGFYSKASDIFAVGVIAYKLICGQFPFPTETFAMQTGVAAAGSSSMRKIRNNLECFEIDWTRKPWQDESQAREFTMWLLQVEAKDRPTVSQALNHDFLAHSGLTPTLPHLPQ